MKKFLKISRALLFIAVVFALQLFVTQETHAADNYTVVSGVLTSYTGDGSQLEIPSDVTSIGENVFSGNTTITGVTLPDGLTTISANAFLNCTSLSYVVIPSSTINIADNAFAGCSSLNIYGVTGSTAQTFATTKGISFVSVYPAAPTITTPISAYNGVSFSWESVPNATDYVVYRKTPSTDWLMLTDKATNSFVDISASYGINYTYTVRASLSIGRNDYLSDLDASKYKNGVSYCPETTTMVSANSTETKSIQVTWNAAANTNLYAIYRRPINGTWSSIAYVNTTSYTDTSVQAGVTYEYFARSLNMGTTTYWGYLNIGGTVSASTNFPDTPSLTSVTTAYNGINISWNTSPGATGYILYRKAPGGAWEELSNTANTTFLDTSASYGTSYSYAVRSYNIINSTTYLGVLDTNNYKTGISYVPETTTMISATPTETKSILISWNSAANTNLYSIYRRPVGGSWSSIAYVNTTSFTDTSVLAGVTYEYFARSLKTGSSTYWGAINTNGLVSAVTNYPDTPILSTAKTAYNGVNLSWSTSTGATGYILYRKAPNGLWIELTNTNSTSYTDLTASYGVTYSYAVRAYNVINSITHLGVLDTTNYKNGISYSPINPEMVSAVTTSSKSILVSWNPSESANLYAVYRRALNGSWGIMGYSSTSNFTDATAQTGVSYEYFARSIKTGSSTYWGSLNSSVAVTGITYFPSQSALSTPTSVYNGVNISWSNVTGAAGYILYRKTSNGVWVELINTASTSFLDSTATYGVNYTYAVRTYNITNSITYLSSFDQSQFKNGISYSPTAPTMISAASTSSKEIKVSWNASNGATLYAVYRKTVNGSWALINYTSATSYIDTTAQTGIQYSYFARALKMGSITYWGSYNSENALSAVTYIPTNPILYSAEPYSSGIKLTWSPAAGATSYIIYRINSDGVWTTLGPITGTEYIDSSITKGRRYTYIVRSLNQVGGTTYVAPFDSTSAKNGIVYYTVNGQILTGWQKIDGRSYYFNGDGELKSKLGIDVSNYQGIINWQAVKDDGIDFAIIRIGWGQNLTSQDDPNAIYNMLECERLGIPYGVYIYSYALTLDMVDGEIAHTLRLLQGRNPTMGVWFDMEDADGYKVRNGVDPYANGALLTDMCVKFVTTLRGIGYTNVGTYANPNYFKNVLNYNYISSVGNIWLAHWGVTSPSSSYPCKIWQYTSSGTVAGISDSTIDMDVYIEN